jgi:hypothetical protein
MNQLQNTRPYFYFFTWRTFVLLPLVLVLLCHLRVADAGLYGATVASHAEKSFVNEAAQNEAPQENIPPASNQTCHCGENPPGSPTTARILAILTSAYTTIETMVRSFAFGFGARMLKFTIVDQNEERDKLHDRLSKSAEVGISVASIVLGMGLFIPVRFRTLWFEY